MDCVRILYSAKHETGERDTYWNCGWKVFDSVWHSNETHFSNTLRV
jgi:hypothetical protein